MAPQDILEEVHVEELPSLASLAAVELDDLLLGRPKRFDAVARLAKALSESVTSEGETRPTVQLDPTRLLVINRAFDDSRISAADLTTVDELVQSTVELTRALEQFKQSTEPSVDHVQRLRSFCLALSRRASAVVYGNEDLEQRSPFRR